MTCSYDGLRNSVGGVDAKILAAPSPPESRTGPNRSGNPGEIRVPRPPRPSLCLFVGGCRARRKAEGAHVCPVDPHDPLRTNRSPSLSLATSTGIAPSIFIGPSANQRVVRVVPGRLFAFAPSSLEWVPTRSLLLCPTVLTKGSKHSAHRPLSGSSEGALDVADGDEPRQRFDSGHADTSIFHCLSQRRSSEAPMPWEPGQGESARHHP